MENKLAWLAGFIDADGCIRLSRGWKKKKGQYSLIPQVSIHNTCLYTMNEVAQILSSVIPGFSLSWKKRISAKHAELVSISIMGIRRVEPVLNSLLPFLITKKLEAQLLLRFIGSRKIGIHNSPYNPMAYRIYEALKFIKLSRNLRDYTPAVELILNEDIVRTNAKALEVAETATRLPIEARREWAKNLVSKYRWHRAG